MRGNDLLFNYGFRYPPPFQSKKEPGFANQLLVLKMRKLWSHDVFPAPKKRPRNGALKLVGKKGGRKGGKGKKTLEQCRGNIKISKGGRKKLSLQNLVQKV